MAAEALGFDAFFLSDHYTVEDQKDLVETWTVLPYLAARTERIRLGTNVTPVTFRAPGMLAKMVATADLLSGGRIILGVGAGWFRRKFDMYSRWYAHRERVWAKRR
jgi:alkanesulfonate monooxygenase SsuD/methylene tetrahydromethanopterin reductase-like flavin-dependent oxidoreductase (luciferase family)